MTPTAVNLFAFDPNRLHPFAPTQPSVAERFEFAYPDDFSTPEYEEDCERWDGLG